MRFVLEGFVVEIRAKRSNDENARFTKTDTMEFCNKMSIAFEESARWNEANGYDVCAESLRDSSNEIYEKLEKQGFYKDLQ